MSFKTELLRLVRGGEDMPMREAAVLIVAHETDSVTMRTVRGMAANLNVQKPCITRALDSLAERGFIARKPDPLDRRSVLIAVTPAGRKFADRLGAA